MNVAAIYAGSDGEATRALYAKLESLGPAGFVAVNLFRAQKCSARAKVYSRRFKGDAYDRKNWSLGNLSRALELDAEKLCIVWGWKIDPAQEFHRWVLYIDLPGVGQVSFHSAQRLSPVDYTGDWDGTHLSAERIVRWVSSLLIPSIL